MPYVRPDVRLPDERARLRAHGRGAPPRRVARGRRARGRGPRRLQHLQRPREGRAEAAQRGRQARAAEARAAASSCSCVAGCVAQQEGERLLARVRHIDLVVGPDNIAELPRPRRRAAAGAPPLGAHGVRRRRAALPRRRCRAGGPRRVSAYRHDDEGLRRALLVLRRPVHARARALPAGGEIVAEVRAGSTPARARSRSSGRRSTATAILPPPARASDAPPPALRATRRTRAQFPALLRRIAREVPGPRAPPLHEPAPAPRSRRRSPRAHAELDVLARHVHLPVQSGSDRVLKRMIRRYTRAEYVDARRRLLRRAARA